MRMRSATLTSMRFFGWLFLATLSMVLMLQLRTLDSGLRTQDTPRGIIGYELAFSRDRAELILETWRNHGVLETARVSLGLDVAFLLVYPIFLAMSVQSLLSAPWMVNPVFSRMGRALGWGILLCIPLDALENVLLWQMISSGASGGRALLAGIAATAKFLLVITTAVWSLMALGRRWIRPSP